MRSCDSIQHVVIIQTLISKARFRLTVFPVKSWTPEKISGMFIVSRPIRSKMKPQKITAKLQYALVTTWIETTSCLFLLMNWLFFTTNLQKPNYRIWNRPRSECKLSKFTRYKFSDEGFSATKNYGSKITNHSQLAWPFELHVKHTGQPRFWLVRYFLLSDTLSSLVWSYLLDSTLLSRNMSLNISFFNIYSLHINKPKYKKNNFSIWKWLSGRFVMKKKPADYFMLWFGS